MIKVQTEDEANQEYFSNLVDKSQAKALGAKCNECPYRYQPFVPPWNIEVGTMLFIGEAPGILEAIEGVPFVGPSGMLLDRILERNGHDPLVIGKTNACLCRPITNADGTMTPVAEALEACQEALQRTIEASPAQIIVTLGNTPTQALDKLAGHSSKDGILSRRGVWNVARVLTSVDDSNEYSIRSLHYLPTLHPAFVLRSPGFIQKLIDDINKAYQGPYAQHQFLTAPYKIIEDFEQLKEMIVDLKSKPTVSFDVETEYLQWYDSPDKKACDVLCLVFAGQTDLCYIVPDTTLTQPRVLEFLQRFFDNEPVLAHNGKFDQSVMLARLGITVKLIDDTMLAHGTISEGKRGHGLKELAQEEFQLPDYEETFLVPIFKQHKMSKDNRNYSVIPRDILYRYAATDAVVTLALYETLKQQLLDENQFEWPYRNIMVRASNALAQVEVNGIPIDYEYLVKVEDVVYKRVEELADELNSLVLQAFADAPIGRGSARVNELINKSKAKRFNPNSPEQVSMVLYNTFGLKLPKALMKPTTTNTGKEALQMLLEEYPNHLFMRLLMEYRRVEKIRSTYVTKLLALADDDNKVHVGFNILGTETGRLSADDSLHGIPNPEDESIEPMKRFGAMIRGAFRAPTGYKIVAADYSQAELRVFACETKEPFLLKAYNDGLDVHNETVKLMCAPMGLDYNTISQPSHSAQKKNVRRLAKNINFGGLLYLGGYKAIAAITGADPSMVKLVMDYYYNKLETARNWQRDQFRFAKKHGYVVNRFGRKRRFILQTTQNIDEIRKASVNAPIQGGASDLTLLSVCQMVEAGINVVHTVHDSILALVPDSEQCYTETMMRGIMVSTGEKYYPEVPWEVDVDIGEYWYDKRPKL